MSEWLKEHAWKSDRFTRADAYQIPPTHSRSTTSRNTDTRRHVLVNHRVDRGLEGVCDTALTQRSFALSAMPSGTARYRLDSVHLSREFASLKTLEQDLRNLTLLLRQSSKSLFEQRTPRLTAGIW